MQVSRAEILIAAAQLKISESQFDALTVDQRINLLQAASHAKHAVAYDHAVAALLTLYAAQQRLAEAQLAQLPKDIVT